MYNNQEVPKPYMSPFWYTEEEAKELSKDWSLKHNLYLSFVKDEVTGKYALTNVYDPTIVELYSSEEILL
jgi:hypothetical protein